MSLVQDDRCKPVGGADVSNADVSIENSGDEDVGNGDVSSTGIILCDARYSMGLAVNVAE